jgi:hypothetical protein
MGGLFLSFRFIFNMEAMQEPVNNQGGHDTHGSKHSSPE